MHRIDLLCDTRQSPPAVIVRDVKTNHQFPPVLIPSPDKWTVHGSGDAGLTEQLRWLLESFLDYPFPPHTERAASIQEALRQWGMAAFRALFERSDVIGHLLFTTMDALEIRVICDDPAMLSWPWEALCHPQLGFIVLKALMRRQFHPDDDIGPQATLSPELPKDCLRILLVTARPFQQDVAYRSISRPLVDLIREENLPASVDVLRPPTLLQLQKHLAERPGRYHILHFDGHGSYGAQDHQYGSAAASLHEGSLLFETADGGCDQVSVGRLTQTLRECAIPFVVLNACRSGQIDEQATGGVAFASVAGALVRAGFQSVLAMAYNLYVSGAREFLPSFYRHLFKTGLFLNAVQRGRQTMHQKGCRSSWNREAILPDWLLPVVYQQGGDLDLGFAAEAVPPAPAVELTGKAQPPTASFVGRDAAIHSLERALRLQPAGMLVHGLGGVGKTTLTQHFLAWLRDTGGLVHPPCWFSFEEIRSAAHVLNSLGRSLVSKDFDCDNPLRQAELIRILHKESYLIVWDNFESVCGFLPEHVSGLLPSADQARLSGFLTDLRGATSKVLLTSRSSEDWLPKEDCVRISLGGLHGDELWDYAAQEIWNLGVQVDIHDHELLALLEELDGHPVLIRAVLAELPRQSAAALRQQAKENLPAMLAKVSDPTHARLLASLDFTAEALTAEERDYLIPLALMERFVQVFIMDKIADYSNPDHDEACMERVVRHLERSGLLTGWRGHNNIFSIHPLLTSWLRVRVLQNGNVLQIEAWRQRFAYIMANLALNFHLKRTPEKPTVYLLHHASFHAALKCAELTRDVWSMQALLLALASYSIDVRDFVEARKLSARKIEGARAAGDKEEEAMAFHQLGIVALHQHHFTEAADWYRQSLPLFETVGLPHKIASTYHQLGYLAEEQRNFDEAEAWHLKSLEISEKHKIQTEATLSYHQLGIIAQHRGKFAAANDLYEKSLRIKQALHDDLGISISYLQMGSLAEEQEDLTTAEDYYWKALAIKQRLQDNHGMGIAWHLLGSVARMMQDYGTAEEHYLSALVIFEKFGDEDRAGTCYSHLGQVALKQRNFAAAESWFNKALATAKKLGDKHAMAIAVNQLAELASEKGDADGSTEQYRKSLELFEGQGGSDAHAAAAMCEKLGKTAEDSGDLNAAGQWYQKALAGFSQIDHTRDRARLCFRLARLAENQEDLLPAEEAYAQAAALFSQIGDDRQQALCSRQRGLLAKERQDFATALKCLLEALPLFLQEGDGSAAAVTCGHLGNLAQAQKNYPEAAGWHHQSLAYQEGSGQDSAAASTCAQLGEIAREQKDFPLAEAWYGKSLALLEKLGDMAMSARINFNIGGMAKRQGNFAKASDCFRKSLAQSYKEGDKRLIASGHYNLGEIALEQKSYSDSEAHYLKCLPYFTEGQDESGLAEVSHRLGVITYAMERWEDARAWHHKSLAIAEAIDDIDNLLRNWRCLGIIDLERGALTEAEIYFRKAAVLDEHLRDEEGLMMDSYMVGLAAQKQGNDEVAEEWYRKSLALRVKAEDKNAMALIFHRFGEMAQRRRDYASAEGWYGKALNLYLELGEQREVADAHYQLGKVAEAQNRPAVAAGFFMEAALGFDATGEDQNARVAYLNFRRLSPS